MPSRWRLLLHVAAVLVASALYWSVVAPSVAAGAIYAAALTLWGYIARRSIEPDWRGLTPAETVLAGSMFGAAIRYPAVRLHARGFTPFQPRRMAVSPNGHMYFCARDCQADFTSTPDSAAWLIHELTHVWQHQTGVPVLRRGLFEREYRYGAVDPKRRLPSYGIEQQAAIVEDYFRLTHGLDRRYGTGGVADYRAVIPFLP